MAPAASRAVINQADRDTIDHVMETASIALAVSDADEPATCQDGVRVIDSTSGGPRR